MQISAQNLLASQQAAAVQPSVQPAVRPAAGFAAALEKTEGFAPLPLKQVAPAQDMPDPAPARAKAPVRLGSTLDIKI